MRLWSLLVVNKPEKCWGDISGTVEGERTKPLETPNLKRETKELSENQSFCEFLISDFYAMTEGNHLVFFACYN